MFDALTDRLSGVFDRLSGRGVLSEKDIDEALREVRVALLEADVALPVVREFISKAKERATGEEVMRLLEELNGHGVTLIIVTHDLALGARARRQLHMEDGELRRDTCARPT